MFKRKKEKQNVVFMFNYVCNDTSKCVAFSVNNGAVCADWYDEDGTRHKYEGVPITDEFWAALEEVTERCGAFNWKAHKLYAHFAFSLDTSVFNAEAVFPSGKSFSANNFHGFPDGFEEAVSSYKALFSSIEH